jgi:hypothetical protein
VVEILPDIIPQLLHSLFALGPRHRGRVCGACSMNLQTDMILSYVSLESMKFRESIGNSHPWINASSFVIFAYLTNVKLPKVQKSIQFQQNMTATSTADFISTYTKICNLRKWPIEWMPSRGPIECSYFPEDQRIRGRRRSRLISPS